jgi:hypothetical protein
MQGCAFPRLSIGYVYPIGLENEERRTKNEEPRAKLSDVICVLQAVFAVSITTDGLGSTVSPGLLHAADERAMEIAMTYLTRP